LFSAEEQPQILPLRVRMTAWAVGELVLDGGEPKADLGLKPLPFGWRFPRPKAGAFSIASLARRSKP
jgi:hypothetical protein